MSKLIFFVASLIIFPLYSAQATEAETFCTLQSIAKCKCELDLTATCGEKTGSLSSIVKPEKGVFVVKMKSGESRSFTAKTNAELGRYVHDPLSANEVKSGLKAEGIKEQDIESVRLEGFALPDNSKLYQTKGLPGNTLRSETPYLELKRGADCVYTEMPQAYPVQGKQVWLAGFECEKDKNLKGSVLCLASKGLQIPSTEACIADESVYYDEKLKMPRLKGVPLSTADKSEHSLDASSAD